MPRPETRRAGRTRAFQILYGLQFAPAGDPAALTRAYRRCPSAEDADASPDCQGFAWELVQGVWANQDRLDRIIRKLSEHWRLERIAVVELCILRLALCEMLLRSDIPYKVAINEAVELAKQFGDDNSRNFVNGILDAAARAMEEGTLAAAQGHPNPASQEE